MSKSYVELLTQAVEKRNRDTEYTMVCTAENLIREISDLQEAIVCAQEEITKHREALKALKSEEITPASVMGE